jgi:hypothetical protein
MDLSKVNLLIGIGGAHLVMLTLGLAAPAHAKFGDATFGASYSHGAGLTRNGPRS